MPRAGLNIDNLKEGQEISPDYLQGAISLSAGQKLLLDHTYNLFFSNIPEFPGEPGLTCRADDVLSGSGLVRVLFSHMNLLIDWSSDPLSNMPAAVGFAVENRTLRELDVYAIRGAMSCNRTTDGTYLFLEDAAPLRPGECEPQCYGSAVGNYVVREFFLSEQKPPINLGRVKPGERLIHGLDVGPRAWAVGLYDLEFVDAASGCRLNRSDLTPGEAVGLETFIAPLGVDLDNFLEEKLASGTVLPQSWYECEHMRGLFVPGIYSDSPAGEASSKIFTINYSADNGLAASFALAAGDVSPAFEPDIFINDRMRNGYDQASPGLKGVNKGNYGADYTIKMELTGPVALVFQGPLQCCAVDTYNQIDTIWLDGQIKALQIKDPNYEQFHTDESALRQPGYGRVIAVFKESGRHDHVLRYIPPPNTYGPVRFYLLPLVDDRNLH